MDRRGFLGILGVLAAGGWLGFKGFLGSGPEKRLKEAMHYRKLGGEAQASDAEETSRRSV